LNKEGSRLGEGTFRTTAAKTIPPAALDGYVSQHRRENDPADLTF
jgi:hypothetical protein